MLSGFFKRLLMGRQLEFVEGDIQILDTKFVMHPLTHHYHWRETMKEKRGKDGLKEIYEIGRATGQELAELYIDKFKISGTESANFWKNLIELSGLGKIKLLNPQEGGKVQIQLESTLAKIYTSKKPKNKEKVDEYLTGLFTGIFEKMYGKKLIGEETKSTSNGDPMGEIIIKPLNKN